MESLIKTWGALSLNKKVTAAAAVLATLMLVYFLARSAAEPQMSLLYGGLDQKNAGEVLAALEQLGVETDVRGDSVYVASAERDRVRLELARQGLPQQGSAGYELLDELSGFGTTTEMFQAAYWRAKEGELARTILSVPGVRSARVHIGAASRRPFSRSSEKSTAAVTVRMAGGRLSEPAALSIRYLVALAVADLAPEQVAVIDAQNGVVLKPGEASLATMGDEAAARRARQLEQELERLLAVRVGENAVRISVTVETSRESRKTSEHLVDPDSQVTLRAETSEISSQNSEPGQPVTVASNLPDGDGAGGASGKSERNESTESVEYQYSVTTRDEIVEPGAVKRLGVAVLVDEARLVADDGTVAFEPRSAEEMAAIEELVKSAVAFDAERGDTVTISSMRFAPTLQPGEEVEIGAIERLLTEHMMTLIQLGLLGVVALALGLFVVRPILMSAPPAAAPALAGGVAAESTAAAAMAASMAGDLTVEGGDAAPAAAKAVEEPPAVESQASIDAAARLDTLRGAVGERPEEAVAMLERWLANVETAEAMEA